MSRPGVAMMMSGLSASAVNCLSMLSPPTRRAIRRSFSFDILRANVNVFVARAGAGDAQAGRKQGGWVGGWVERSGGTAKWSGWGGRAATRKEGGRGEEMSLNDERSQRETRHLPYTQQNSDVPARRALGSATG